MYLKQIIASGFKSFADKLDISLDGKITCIVGPNGSGKSNIVDAVRWVLGEQSVKSLRGDGTMSDVIFTGSNSRKPLNVASVELVFDNHDHYLNIAYPEVSIKRKVYRSGENEYFLNHEKCRLKDIVDLFIDSGVGKESFNIISQGEVQTLLSHSAYDRRLIFEEAAGILKYKKRKEEALRKLDKTHQNIDRVNDIIQELESQVVPLKEQSEKAKIYLENKEGLEKYEVALLVYDIEDIHQKTELLKQEQKDREEEMLLIQQEVVSKEATEVEDKNTLLQLEKDQNEKTALLLKVTEDSEKLNSERLLLEERSKGDKSQDELAEKLRLLLEERGKVETDWKVEQQKLLHLVQEEENQKKKCDELSKKLEKQKQKQEFFQQDYFKRNRDVTILEQKEKSLDEEIERGGNMPNSVRSVLRATSLFGICDTLGNILEVEDKYTKALEISIQSSKNFIITKNEEASMKAITYLKEKKLGRATFFPLTVIESRYVDDTTLEKIKQDKAFIGILSDLVTYDKKYKNIVENQLGTTLVCSCLEEANRLSQKIKHRYRIVTLDGDMIHVGGSMSGGSNYQAVSTVSLRQEKIRITLEKEQNQKELENINQRILELQKEIKDMETQYFLSEKELVVIKNQKETLEKEEKVLAEKNKRLFDEWSSYQTLTSKSLDQKEKELITAFHEKQTEKELLSAEIKKDKENISSLKTKMEEDSAYLRVKNQRLRELEKILQNSEVQLNRYDVELDHMLLVLNEEYSLTFEKAKDEYFLDKEVEEARECVNRYKKKIKEIGMVNLLAISEYEKVSVRYEFLKKQKEDLNQAENTLLEIMKEMDEVMKEDFLKTFQEIEKEFKKVFKELFKGGEANLILTDPNDLLTTGIDIIASPPGKKLRTITLLSGGEKTLTAISLLFAILNVRTVPFCLFDEVEAALDEANVNEFGNYLSHYKDKTQFLIITHKKKTMEYADTLYGITMQESGVSKLVSVKLNDIEEVI